MPPQTGAQPRFTPPAPAPRKSRTGWLVGGLAAVVVVVLTVVLIVALNSGGNGGGGGGDPPSTEARPSGSDSDVNTLLSYLPLDFDEAGCTSVSLLGDGDLANLECGASNTQPGAETSAFRLYNDEAAVQASFESVIADLDLAESNEFECTEEGNYGNWMANDGASTGYYSCLLVDGVAEIQWTENEFGFYGVVSVSGGGGSLTDLFDWWGANSAVSA